MAPCILSSQGKWSRTAVHAHDSLTGRRWVQSAAMVDNFPALSGLIDGIVLARGWLGLHMAPEHMAPLQKRLLRFCNINGKLALVTRIVDSMQVRPRLPTHITPVTMSKIPSAFYTPPVGPPLGTPPQFIAYHMVSCCMYACYMWCTAPPVGLHHIMRLPSHARASP